jgi:hypothetical protein
MFTSRLLGVAAGLAMLMGVGATAAWAAPDPLQKDTFLEGPTTLSAPLPPAELAFIKSASGDSEAKLITKIESPTVSTAVKDGTTFYFTPIPEATKYFVLKFGSGLDQFYAFANIADLGYAIWTVNPPVQTGTGLSHISAYVPLPAAVWFLLSALGGLFGLRWMRRPKVEGGLSAA